ncbi:hypothetical protein [Nostoc sp. 'Peltigera malacea cyanobiont' DB3992]|nr:hypothetical protein [Nostoc sp. 'Peltigera malacea cyanobiont' DB3992]
MLKYDPLACLPSSEELPDSDDTPGILPREWLYWYDRQEQRL